MNYIEHTIFLFRDIYSDKYHSIPFIKQKISDIIIISINADFKETKMKKTLFMIVFACALLASTAFADDRPNNIEFGAGMFMPSSDYADAWDNGADFNLNYIYELSDFFAIDGGVHAYATSASTSYTSADVNTTGAEVLGRLFQNVGPLRLYVSGGMGFYNNKVTVNGVSYTGYYNDNNSNTVGLVGKAGVDFISENGVYLGFNIKKFSNYQNFYYSDGSSDRVNLGGTAYNAVVGYKFQ